MEMTAYRIVQAKQATASVCTLQYFNNEEPITIQVDASSIGVSAALMQQWKIISYHFKALTPTQQQYSNIERDCYGLVNGIEHFHHYIFGCEFTVQTDHQPLVNLTSKALREVSPCLQHLLLKVTQYRLNTIYVKHDGVPIANCLSHNMQIETALEDETINITVAAISLFKESKINQIKHKTSQDLILVELAKTIQSGWSLQNAELSPDLHAFGSIIGT